MTQSPQLPAGLPSPAAAPVIRTGREPGPTVLLVATADPLQPAGARVLEQVQSWPLLRGRLIIAPPLALGGEAMIAELVKAMPPDWVAELRETEGDEYFHPGKATAAQEMTRAIRTEVNAGITPASRRFVLRSGKLPGSTVAAMQDIQRGIPVLIIATKYGGKNDPPSRRIRQFRQIIHALLFRLGMMEATPPALVMERESLGKLRVAMYDSSGVGGTGPYRMEEVLRLRSDIAFRRVGLTEIKNGILQAQFDALIYPGGASSTMGKTLNAEGREAIRKFVWNGGGYIGVCAGAYLSSRTYPWSLHILNAHVVDREHAHRGRATLTLELTPDGQKVLGADYPAPIRCIYHNGPVLAPGSPSTGLSPMMPLIVYRSEITARGGKRGIMVNSPAVATGTFGRGRVVAVSPHPEQTPGLEAIIPRLVDFVTRRT